MEHGDLWCCVLQASYFHVITSGCYLNVIMIRSEKGCEKLSVGEYYIVRVMLFAYSVIGWATWFKEKVFGPLNWTICLRRFSISNEKTIAESGEDCTYVVYPPNLTDLIPTARGSSISPLAQSFCCPGKYLYLLTPPVSTAHTSITSVHIFAFGSIVGTGSDAGDNVEPLEWFDCGILRRTKTGIIQVLGPARLSFNLQFHPKDSSGYSRYGVVHYIKASNALVQALHNGDMIALWARGHTDRVHKPTMAMIKVF